MAVTQKEIIETIKTGNLINENPSVSFKVIETFNSLDRSKNYAWRFQKTQQYWTSANWNVVAREVKAQM